MMPGAPPAEVEVCAEIVRRFIADAGAKLRLPTPGEQLAIDTVAAWTYGARRPARQPAEIIPFAKRGAA
jgi:hypothetical protein